MAQIFACPFCREMWKEDEHVERCPDCDVDLVPLHLLPPSAETLLEREAEILRTPPELQRRPFFDFGRGRGLVLFIAVLGLASFFLPWFTLRKPELLVLSGFRIARYFAGWVWAGAVGWFILIPLVLTRRTITDLRGVRAIVAFFASLTLGEILVLSSVAPASRVRVPVEFGWSYGLLFSALTSIAGVIVALGLGGALPRRTDPKDSETALGGAKNSETALGNTKVVRRSRYETLH